MTENATINSQADIPDQWATGNAAVSDALHWIANGMPDSPPATWGTVLVYAHGTVTTRRAYISPVYGRIFYSPRQGDQFQIAPEDVVRTWRVGTHAQDYSDYFADRPFTDPHAGLGDR